MTKITHAEIRMYKMGTGDCFAIKLFANDEPKFKIMIDCGTWSGGAAHLRPYIQDLMAYVNNEVDLLIVTHEHKDHVHVFEACSDMFDQNSQFHAKKIWMAWTEKDSDSKVKRWKTEYGEKKLALKKAAREYNAVYNTKEFRTETRPQFNGISTIRYKTRFSQALREFSDLHVGSGTYVGALEGMRIAKQDIRNGGIEYLKPGMVFDNLDDAEGVRFHILGPPENLSEVKVEKGKKGSGETYDHNSELAKNNAFAAAVLSYDQDNKSEDLLPFDPRYVVPKSKSLLYDLPAHKWRKIDHEWLNSAGMLALRMNSITNNLSLAIAIEFENSGRVMLFPGDAEFGSWNSWHSINWGKTGKNKKHLTEDLLNRTVFYKVAHHLSHNGTARKKGLDMMNHPDLIAMATLDYGVISPRWTGTMPNANIVKELIDKTKGRLIIMNENKLMMGPKRKDKVSDKIREARAKMTKSEQASFNKAFDQTNPLYYQVTISGKA